MATEQRQRQASNASSIKSAFSGIFSFKHNDDAPTELSSDSQDYEIIQEICGVDDISYLYLARYTPTNDLVSLIFTDMALSPDFEFIDELIKSVRNTKENKHKHILPYWHSFEEGDNLWIVTPPITYGTCKHILRMYRPEGFDESIVCIILRDILQVLAHLHCCHKIHNDIRAENILLSQRGNIMISGLRQMLSLTTDGKLKSSVFSNVGDNFEWVAPEIACQNSKYDEKSDIYSFGITAIELALGKTPFDQFPPLKILLCKMNYPCPGIAGREKMSEAFWKVISKCVDNDPKKRPSAEELLEEPIFKHVKTRPYLKSFLSKIIQTAEGIED